MTKEKAKQKAEQGFKVRHESWLPHIYMHIGNTKYLDRAFSLYAQEHGWEVVEEPQLTIKEDFWVECNVCKQRYLNHVGSTPCCGFLANILDDDTPTTKTTLYASVDGKPIKIVQVDMNKKQLTIKEEVLDKILYEFNALITEHVCDVLRKGSSIVPIGLPIKINEYNQQMREIIANNLNAKIEKK